MNKSEYIYCDNKYFNELNLKTKIRLYLTKDHWVVIRHFLQCLRRQEYYQRKRGICNKLLSIYWGRRKNSIGLKIGFHIPAFTLGEGVSIYHHGAITINGNAKIGKNCVLHGMNCIGNNGLDIQAPIVGDGVDIGVGVSIIGGITIADSVVIGAGAVVIKDCLQTGAILVGVPARNVKKE